MKRLLQDINDTMKFTNTNLELRPNDIQENEVVRQHIKLLLNSALGKLNQKQHYIRNSFVKSAEEMEKLFEEKRDKIIGFNDDHEDICQVFYEGNNSILNRKRNPTCLAFITAKARIFLHKRILDLAEKNFLPFYVDTDSILFAGNSKKHLCPLKFGHAFGDFKHELGENTTITSFNCMGRKNFSLIYNENGGGEEKRLTKICGMSLNSKISQEQFALSISKRNPKLTQVRAIFDKDKDFRIPHVQERTLNNVNIRCERKVDNKSPYHVTYPWGFSE